jgi:hypothetical protein
MLFIPSMYNTPIQVLKDIFHEKVITIDVHEYFVKQSFRSRCHILSPNGIQTLIVPIIHNDRSHTPMKDIKISYSENWQIHHWRSICSFYNRSPFFEHYKDDFNKVYSNRYTYLVDLNRDLFSLSLELANVELECKDSVDYSETDQDEVRSKLNSGLPYGAEPSYLQVYSYKFGYVPGLSILDLLFNTGPEAVKYLKAND